MTEESDFIDLDNTVNEDAIDSDRMTLTFSKQTFGTEGDDFEDAAVEETEKGKHLMMELTMTQAQRWADTIAARLHELREQAADQTAHLDQVYLICISDSYGNGRGQPETVAFTRKAAVKAKHELSQDLQYGQEVEIESIDYTTS